MTLLEAHEHSARPCARAAPGIPVRQVFIVTCHDHRVDPAIVLRLQLGDAPVIRNARAASVHRPVNAIRGTTDIAWRLRQEIIGHHVPRSKVRRYERAQDISPVGDGPLVQNGLAR